MFNERELGGASGLLGVTVLEGLRSEKRDQEREREKGRCGRIKNGKRRQEKVGKEE